MAREDWEKGAVCAQTDPEVFFATGQHFLAKSICARCPVINDCLSEALEGEVQFGTWGGMTGPERLAMLRDMHGPEYTWPKTHFSWADLRVLRTWKDKTDTKGVAA